MPCENVHDVVVEREQRANVVALTGRFDRFEKPIRVAARRWIADVSAAEPRPPDQAGVLVSADDRKAGSGERPARDGTGAPADLKDEDGPTSGVRGP